MGRSLPFLIDPNFQEAYLKLWAHLITVSDRVPMPSSLFSLCEKWKTLGREGKGSGGRELGKGNLSGSQFKNMALSQKKK